MEKQEERTEQAVEPWEPEALAHDTTEIEESAEEGVDVTSILGKLEDVSYLTYYKLIITKIIIINDRCPSSVLPRDLCVLSTG